MKILPRFLLLLIIALPTFSLGQAVCSSNDTLQYNMIGGKTASPDGYIHVTYDFGITDASGTANRDTSPPDQIVQEVMSAIQDWNNYKDTTGIVFDRLTSGYVDFSVNLDNNSQTNGGCIASSDRFGEINYNDTFLGMAVNPSNGGLAKAGFSHELGHLLGMDDSSGNTIMAHASPPCAAPTLTGAATVTPNDALIAFSCVSAARVLQAPQLSPPIYWYGPVQIGNCYYYTLETDVYVMADNGVYSLESTSTQYSLISCS